MTLISRDARLIWHPYTQMLTRPEPIPIVRGEGVYSFTEDGRRLLDGTSSWWVNIHGHSHPALNAALAAQARELEHVVFADCTHRPAVELGERLVDNLPRGLTRVFYSDDGSTAVEVAMKMACQYWGNRGASRRTFIALQHAYHGDTVGAMSAGEDSVFTRPFAPMLFKVLRAYAFNPYCYRCPLGLDRATCHIECLDQPPTAVEPSQPLDTLGALLERHGSMVAAVIVEPMFQGAGGMVVWPAEFLAGVRRLCDEHGVLMIADELLTGFGAPERCSRASTRTFRLTSSACRRRSRAATFRSGATVSSEAVSTAVSELRSDAHLLSRAFVHRQSAGLRGGDRQPRSLR